MVTKPSIFNPNEITLGALNYSKIKNGQTIELECDASTKSKYNHRKINLPNSFEIVEFIVPKHEKNNTFLSTLFGRIQYNSFDSNCILFGKFCQLYLIHKFMENNNLQHEYYGNMINYFDNL
jgi:hypothetical protein